MQQIPIYEVWIQSWTTEDVAIFGALALAALAVIGAWARRRARPSGEEAGLGLSPRG
jgi:hypothetical protein